MVFNSSLCFASFLIYFLLVVIFSSFHNFPFSFSFHTFPSFLLFFSSFLFYFFLPICSLILFYYHSWRNIPLFLCILFSVQIFFYFVWSNIWQYFHVSYYWLLALYSVLPRFNCNAFKLYSLLRNNLYHCHYPICKICPHSPEPHLGLNLCFDSAEICQVKGINRTDQWN